MWDHLFAIPESIHTQQKYMDTTRILAGLKCDWRKNNNWGTQKHCGSKDVNKIYVVALWDHLFAIPEPIHKKCMDQKNKKKEY